MRLSRGPCVAQCSPVQGETVAPPLCFSAETVTKVPVFCRTAGLCVWRGRVELWARLCWSPTLVSGQFCVFCHYFDSLPLFLYLSAKSRS